MADVLYLVKANRVREYHHQNLAILAAPDGERFEISYGERWVQPGLNVERGQGGAIVIADSPYRHYQPLRWCVVEEADVADRRLRLTVRVGSFIVGGEQLTERWGADADEDAAQGRDKTRPYFAFVEENHGLRNPHSRDEADRAWHLAIDGLAANEYFTGASVARIGEVSRTDGVPVEAGQGVAVGTEVILPVEVRSIDRDESLLEAALESDPPDGAELVDAVTLPTDGETEVKVRLLAPGPVKVRLNLLPDALRSSRPSVTLMVVDTSVESTTPPETPATGAGVDVRPLVRRIRREAKLANTHWIGLFEDFFVPWSDGDTDLVTEYADLLFDEGRYDQVEAVVSALERRSPRLEFLLLVAAIHNGHAAARVELLTRVDLESGDHFGLLLDALDDAPAETLRPVVEPLYKDVLGDDRKLDLIRRVIDRVPSHEFATALAEELAYADPEAGADALMRRWPEPATMYEPALHELIGIGARLRQLTPYVRQWVGALAEQRNWAGLSAAVPDVRKALTTDDRAAVLGSIARDLMTADDEDAEAAGFALLCEAATEACTTGDLDTAADLAGALRTHLGESVAAESRSAAEHVIGTIETALEQSDELSDWRRQRSETQHDRLAPHCRNKVLHLVGGLAEPWEAELKPNLELATLERHEAEKDKSPRADWADSLNPDEDIVVVLWQRIGHALSGRVKAACKKQGVLHIEARTGQRGLLDALETALLPRFPDA